MIRLFSLLIFAALFIPGGLVRAESVADFSVVYNLKSDGTVLVTETIDYDFVSNERHGIYRVIESEHPQPASSWYQQRFIELTDLEVLQDGETSEYLLTNSGSQSDKNIRIGDEEKTISGLHTYTISYVLLGALSYGPDGAEFYYNVTGFGWEVPIDSVSAVVVTEDGVVLGELKDCYQGEPGGKNRCVIVSDSRGQTTFIANNIGNGQGMTIAQSVASGSVAVLIKEKTSFIGGIIFIVNQFKEFLYLLAVGWLLWLLREAYLLRNRFKIKLPVVAQYEPYDGLLPMYTGVLYDNELNPRDITAGIIYLAEQGYIKIRRTEEKVLWLFKTNDYEITLLRQIPYITGKRLKSLLEIFFYYSSVVGEKVNLAKIAQTRSQSNAKILIKLKSDFKNDLKEDGFLVKTDSALKHISCLAFISLIIFALLIFVNIFLAVSFMIVVVSSLVSGHYQVRTTKGHEAKNHIDGFKLFLSVTDKERFDFHNAPEKSPELFMKYLPYAIALGVEEKWQEVFADITIPKPDWYDSSSAGAFRAAAFTSEMSSFSSSLSASSGTSGSSGGGSSGGGGGGGGGGSW